MQANTYATADWKSRILRDSPRNNTPVAAVTWPEVVRFTDLHPSMPWWVDDGGFTDLLCDLVVVFMGLPNDGRMAKTATQMNSETYIERRKCFNDDDYSRNSHCVISHNTRLRPLTSRPIVIGYSKAKSDRVKWTRQRHIRASNKSIGVLIHLLKLNHRLLIAADERWHLALNLSARFSDQTFFHILAGQT